MFYINKIKLDWYGHLGFDKEMVFDSGVNLVIGKNGSGKTSLLIMIDGIARNTNRGLDPEALEKYKENDELTKVTCKESDNSDSMISSRRQGNAGAWQNHQVLDKRVRFITSDRKVHMASAATSPIPAITRDIAIPEPGAEIDISLEFTQAILKDLWEKVEEVTKSQDIAKEILESYKEGLIDFDKDIMLDLKRSQNPIYFTDFRDREIQIENLSSGEKEYLYFYAFLRRVQNDRDKVILIDEPELHLHSSQLKKLCELISVIGEKNQVIIATHSGEILQSFIMSNIILLDRGNVSNIKSSSDLKKALDNIGLPVDPSVFTARWICAENEPEVALGGSNAPTTPTVLEWVFGKSIKNRYWSFADNRRSAEAVVEGIKVASSDPVPIELHVILDGDKAVDSVEKYPPKESIETEKGLYYWPFWEIENLFLFPQLVDKIVGAKEGKSGFDQLWDKVIDQKEKLFKEIHKSIVKNQLRHYSVDRIIKGNPSEDLTNWKKEIAGFNFDDKTLRTAFDKIIDDKNWQWIPGKEAMAFFLELKPNLWDEIKILVKNKELNALFLQKASIKEIIESIVSYS
ncbi:MAG: ATP-binding protein [Candidatus Omnitrophica bacterium]|nr:ATP-binding protein [Candidatus Omnitrophota bacterium]MBU1894208.1 ATP-binding protein [Candidatus Omnitrophota bacterium]